MRKASLLPPIILMFIILAVLLVFMCLPLGQANGNAAGGDMDLRGSDLAKSVYRLSGQWRYAPGRLVEPDAFPADASLLEIPSSWSDEGGSLNNCATYRLTVYTDDERQLALYVPEIYTAYKLFVNGEFVRGAGVVADNPADGEPAFESVLVPVRASGGAVDIVLQASNYHWMRPHLNNMPLLGESDSMNFWFFRTRTLYVLAMGFIIASAFYHFALYILRRQMVIYLLFSLMCLICFWRLALETDGMSDFTGWFSSGAGVLDGRIFTVLFFLNSVLAALFSIYVFSKEWMYKHRLPAFCYCVAGSALMVILPLNVTWFAAAFAALTIPPLLLAGFIAIKSGALRDNKVTWLYFIAVVFYLLVGGLSKFLADHLLYMTSVLTNIYMIMAQSLVLARQYSDTVAREQELAAKTAAMEQSAKVRSYMIDTLSHEVRTPLTVMSSYAQLAVKRISEGKIDDLTISNLKKISDESKRLAELASRTLRLSSLSDIPSVGGFTQIDVGELAAQIAYLFEPMAQKHGRKLGMRLPGDSQLVFGSADSLTRLIWNLLDNALTHSGRGDIEIEVSGGESDVRLIVRDDGEGISRELLPKVFERGVSGRQDGTGIGLSLCRDIAHELNGAISIESEPGEGTTVTVTMPVVSG